MALQGTLDTFALPDVLRLLAATKKTGRLRITGPRGSGSAWVDGGSVAGVEASHAPHATEPADALFELLRFEEGSFTFEPDVSADGSAERLDVEVIVEGAEALLREWREIESVVPSMQAWVRLRRSLDDPVTVEPAAWTTLVAVGAGATVSDIADRLELAELPVSRAVRDLLELGVAELAPEAPEAPAPAVEQVVEPAPPAAPVSPAALADPGRHELDVDGEHTPEQSSELDAEPEAEPVSEAALDLDSEPAHQARRFAPPAALAAPAELADVVGDDEPEAVLPIAAPIRARRARGISRLDDDGPREPERFVPLELPGGLSGSYDGPVAGGEVPAADAEPGVDDLAAAFPGLANRAAMSAPVEPDDDEVAQQLATLSPRAAEAVRAAAEAATAEERDAAIEAAAADGEEPVSRGLLLKFLSSVKS